MQSFNDIITVINRLYKGRFCGNRIMDNNKTLGRNVLFNTAGNIIYFVCQWLITGLLIKTLSGENGITNAGLLTTAMTATAVFLTLSSFGMRNYQVSDLNGKYSDGCYFASRAVTFSVSVMLCIVFSLVSGYRDEQLGIIVIVLFYRLLESLTDVFHGCCQRAERMDIIGISYTVRGIAGVAAFTLGMKLTSSLWLSLLIMTLVCYTFSILYDVIGTKKYYTPLGEVKAKSVAMLLTECAPLAIYVFLNTATSSVPKLMLERLTDSDTMGVYGLVSSPVMIIQVGAAFLFTPFVTTFAHKLADGDASGFKKLAAIVSAGIGVLGAVCCGGVLLVGKWGLNLLYGSEVAAHDALLVPLVICSSLTALSLFLCMLLTVLRDRRGLIAANTASLVTAAATSAPLIKTFNLFGTCYATIIALLVNCAVLVLFGMKKLSSAKQTQNK